METKTTTHKKIYNWILAAFALVFFVGLVSTSQGSAQPGVTRVPDPKPGATDTLRIFISSSGQDTNSGLSQGEPVRTIVRASQVAQSKWDEGLARGDVEVRFMDDPNIVPLSQVQWNFAADKGKYVRFMPAWYTNDADAASRPLSDWPLFTGISNLDEADMPLRVAPEQNKGGSYEFIVSTI